MSKIQFETDRHPLNEITIGKLLTDDVVYFQYHEYDSLRANIGIQRLLDEKRQYIKATIQKGLNSLNIFSNSLPNLKSLYLDAPEIQSFAPLQNIATSLENFGLNNTVHFHEIPQNFPKLKNIGLKVNQLQNLNHFPTTLPNLESLGLTSDSLLSLYGLPSSLPQLINISITSDSLRTLYGLPSSLPALEQISLTLTSPHLGDIFTAFPKSLPNLKKIRIIAPALATLDGFPVDVPLLTELTLRGTFPTRGSLGYQDENMTQISSFKGMPLDLPALHYFQFYSASMKKIAGIPQFMPQLQQIRLHCPHLRVLEGFPTSLPLLTAFNLECHHLRSLHGYPTDAPRLKAFHCQENKLTRIDVDLARHPWMTYVYFQGNPLKSLHGFPYRFLFRMESFFSQMVHLRNGVEGRYQPPFQFSPRGMEFILAWLNSPLQAGERTLKAFSLKGDDYESMKDSFRTSHFTTEESCQALFAFYEKSPLALAQQYVHSRQYGLHDGPPAEPLTEDEYGRLLYEVEDPEIAYLRSHLPEEDRVIRSFETF